jgi:tetratricopeptide (TPR) repeat protein
MSHLFAELLAIRIDSPMIRMFFVAVGLLLLFTAQSNAQGVGSSRGLPSGGEGIHTIQGRVYAPDGKAVSLRLRVRLESPDTSPMSSVTDEDGAFIFARIPPGNYRLTVEGGPDFESSYEYPSIYREGSAGGRIVRLAIFMRPKEKDDFPGVHKDAVTAYKKARELGHAGEHTKAIEQLNKALAVYPKFGPALHELGVQYLKTGQVDKAAEALDSAVKLAPEEFLPRLNYGFALLSQKKFDLAEEQLRLALAKNNAAPTGHMYLGIALMSQQKLDEAEKELLQAVNANNAEVASAHRYLGGIYWGKRDYKRAADELETYLKLSPKAADAERTKAAIKELRAKQ